MTLELYPSSVHDAFQGVEIPYSPHVVKCAQQIHEACKGPSFDQETLLSDLGSQSLETRHVVALCYKELYCQSLQSAFQKKEMSDEALVRLLRLLATPLPELEAQVLSAATKDTKGAPATLLMQVIAGRTNEEMSILKNVYYDLVGQDVAVTMDSELSGDFRKVVLARLQAPQVPYNPAVHTAAKAEEEAVALYKAGQGRLGTKEEVFVGILVKAPPEFLKMMDTVYVAQYRNDIAKAVDKEFSGDAKRGLKYLVQCTMNPYPAIAEVFEQTLNACGTDKTGLSTTLVRYQSVLPYVKAAYKKLYRKQLRDRISEETSGDYKKLVLGVFDAPRDHSKTKMKGSSWSASSGGLSGRTLTGANSSDRMRHISSSTSLRLSSRDHGATFSAIPAEKQVSGKSQSSLDECVVRDTAIHQDLHHLPSSESGRHSSQTVTSEHGVQLQDESSRSHVKIPGLRTSDYPSSQQRPLHLPRQEQKGQRRVQQQQHQQQDEEQEQREEQQLLERQEEEKQQRAEEQQLRQRQEEEQRQRDEEQQLRQRQEEKEQQRAEEELRQRQEEEEHRQRKEEELLQRQEVEQRQRAEEELRKGQEEEQRQRAEEEQRQRQEEEQRQRAEEELRQRQEEEEQRQWAEEELRQRQEEEQRQWAKEELRQRQEEEEQRQWAEEELRQRQEEEEHRQREEEELLQRQEVEQRQRAEEKLRKRQEEEQRQRAEEEQRQRQEEEQRQRAEAELRQQQVEEQRQRDEEKQRKRDEEELQQRRQEENRQRQQEHLRQRQEEERQQEQLRQRLEEERQQEQLRQRLEEKRRQKQQRMEEEQRKRDEEQQQLLQHRSGVLPSRQQEAVHSMQQVQQPDYSQLLSYAQQSQQSGFPPQQQPYQTGYPQVPQQSINPLQHQPSYPPQQHESSYHQPSTPGYTPQQRPSLPLQQPIYPSQRQQIYPSLHSIYPQQQQSTYPPQQQPSYSLSRSSYMSQESYTSSQQSNYPSSQHGYSSPQLPAYPQTQHPGYQPSQAYQQYLPTGQQPLNQSYQQYSSPGPSGYQGPHGVTPSYPMPPGGNYAHGGYPTGGERQVQYPVPGGYPPHGGV